MEENSGKANVLSKTEKPSKKKKNYILNNSVHYRVKVVASIVITDFR